MERSVPFLNARLFGMLTKNKTKQKQKSMKRKKEILKKSLTQSIMEEDSIKECGNGKLNLQSSA